MKRDTGTRIAIKMEIWRLIERARERQSESERHNSVRGNRKTYSQRDTYIRLTYIDFVLCRLSLQFLGSLVQSLQVVDAVFGVPGAASCTCCGHVPILSCRIMFDG